MSLQISSYAGQRHGLVSPATRSSKAVSRGASDVAFHKLSFVHPFNYARSGRLARHERCSLATRAFLNFGKKSAKKVAPPKRETVIPEPSFNIPIVLLGLSGLSAYEGVEAGKWLFGILGVFLAFQATQIRFVFDDEALEVAKGKDLDESENAFVGGANRWKFSSFVNWEFWWPGFPVLVYFKETQTQPEGQIHFFPVIFNGKQLYNVMAERCGPSQNSGPKS